MIEADLEKIVVDSFKTVLDGFDTLIYGAWLTTDGGIKSEEEYGVESILTVKALPRSYETPTIPYASITFQIALVVRSDVDFNGRDYLGMTDLISLKMQTWQSNYASYSQEFATDNFEPTGFQLDGGDCGIDNTNKVWSYVQNFTVYGIIK